MNRDELTDLAVSKLDSCKALLLNLPTGTGKTKIAIDCINHICDEVYNIEHEEAYILIVVPQKVLIDNWKKELTKWHCNTDCIQFICYNSLAKYNNILNYYDLVIYDEMQHISEARRKEVLKLQPAYKIIGLSATIPKELLYWFQAHYNTEVIKTTTAEAIDNNILPEPKFIRIPLLFDNILSEQIIINPSVKGTPVVISYRDRWKYMKDKKHKYVINCTKSQYNEYISSKIDFYKRLYFRNNNIGIKNKWLIEAGKRLKWLAKVKLQFIKLLLQSLSSTRTITFCASIEDSNTLCKYSIDSKSPNNTVTLKKYNEGKINHITAVSMLDEGCNLVNTPVGIMASITASSIKQVQRIGRLLRHDSPVVIVPYWENTREEEIVDKMLEPYNSDSIITIHNIKDLNNIINGTKD